MKKPVYCLLLALALITIFSCNDPIFYMAAEQPPLLEPLIKGSPTKFLEHNGLMYVASGKNLWSFDGTRWTTIKSFSSIVADIAVTANDYFYVRLAASNDTLYYADFSLVAVTWTGIATGLNIQSIFGAGNNLYISARAPNASSNSYSISRLTGNGAVINTAVTDSTAGFINLVYDGTDVYYCSQGSAAGIFRIPSGSLTPQLITGSNSVEFTGIIRLVSGEIVAITRNNNGQLYSVTSTEVKAIDGVSLGRPSNSMGALALWTDGTNHLLLAGTQDITNTANTSHTHGYKELLLSPSGGIQAGNKFEWPGESEISTVLNKERDKFATSLGKHGVNHIYQSPFLDAKSGSPIRVLFASTQQDGVWSYRDRGDDSGWHWNAEQQP